MKKFLSKLIVFSCLLIQSASVFGAHQAGGYLSYKCLGGTVAAVQYEISFSFYIDSTNLGAGNTPTDSIPITIFNGAGAVDQVFWLSNQISITQIPDNISNPCVVSSPSLNILEYFYRDTVTLVGNQSYDLVYQRCCKSPFINNTFFVSNVYGNTFLADIPDFSVFGCNSSPVFNKPPPLVLCRGFDVYTDLDLSAQDTMDNDVLVYSFCSPLDYPPAGGVEPIPANPPPYGIVQFGLPQTVQDPVPSNPSLQINSQTGRFTGIPDRDGRYLIGICIQEFRAGVLISTTRRDIEVSTAGCTPAIITTVVDQQQVCKSLKVDFKNNSTGDIPLNFRWDFGDLMTLADTSRMDTDSYTYPGPGTYNITVITNPDKPACDDTNRFDIVVKPLLIPTIIQSGTVCENKNSIDFDVGGIFESTANFRWFFGPMASIDSMNSKVVTGVNYPSTGTYTVELIVEESGCSDTVRQDVIIRDNPIVSFTQSDSAGCYPLPVNFTSSVNASGGGTIVYDWDFGDGGNSTLANPTHTYMADGSYNVSLTVMTTTDCIDTVTIVKNNAVFISLDSSTNNVAFSYSDSAGCFPFPVQFTDQSTFEGNATFAWTFGDGGTSSLQNPSHTYMADGYYDVGLTLTATDKCIETINLSIDSAIHVSLDSSTNNIDFSYNPEAGCAPLDVQFTNRSVFQGNADFTWTFGDGASENSQSPSHTYIENGYYDVSLTMTTTDKCLETLTKVVDSAIYVSLDSSKNRIDFDFFPKEGCLPFTVQFLDSSFVEGNANYFWDFGDGTLSTDQNPTKLYSDTGVYTIGLLLIPTEKCVDTLVRVLSDTLKVLPVPIAKINASDSALSLKEANYTFNNVGSEFVVDSKYLINGVEVASTDVLNYQFSDTGHFTVSYIAINGVGCEDTSTAEVFVFDEFQFVIPNVFTPNGDGINDAFEMRACGVYDYDIKIYNRYGEQIFKSNSMNINWDGRVAGLPINSGIYYYTIRIKDFKGAYLNYNGAVTVLE